MTPIISIDSMPCPDPGCLDGKILVYNVYAADPLKPEKQDCDVCGGSGFLIKERTAMDYL